MSVKDKRLAASDEYWHKRAELFSQAYSAKDLLLQPNKAFLRQRQVAIARYIPDDPAATVLDAGCGSGEFVAILAQRCKHVIGVDYSAIMIDLARKSSPPPNTEFHQADCANMPVADHSVDYLFSMGLLDYLPDLDAVLREFRRVSKPGAMVVFTVPKTPSIFEPFRWSAAVRGALFKIPPLVNILSRRRLDALLQGHDMTAVDVTSLWTTMWIVRARINASPGATL